MDLVWSKVLSLFIMLAVSLAAALIPYFIFIWKFKRGGKKPSDKIISLFNCFAGGVFLATTLLHLIPETQLLGKVAFELAEITTLYPVTELLISVGFFLTLFLEQVVHACSRRVSAPSLVHAHSHGHSHNHSHKEIEESGSRNGKSSAANNRGRSKNNISGGDKDKDVNFFGGECSVDGDIERANNGFTGATKITSEIDIENGDTSSSDSLPTSSTLSQTNLMPDSDHVPKRAVVALIYQIAANLPGGPPRTHERILKHGEQDLVLALARAGTRRGCGSIGLGSLLLTIALALHTLFEGLAIGAQGSDRLMWTLWGAIMTHKVIVAVTVGIRFAVDVDSSTTSAVVMSVIFAAGSPLGIGIGAAVTSSLQGVTGAIVEWVLNCIAAGTFIFVCFFEVLGPEMARGDHSLLQAVTMLGGFVLLALLVIYHE